MRAFSNGLVPPLDHTKAHNHYPLPEKQEALELIHQTKQLALIDNSIPRTIIRKTQLCASDEAIAMMSRPDAIKQMIRRERKKKFGIKTLVAKTVAAIEIPKELRSTHKGENFYYDDSSSKGDRMIVFTTKKNLELLSTHRNWFMDGTFDITPTFFTQLYTIHIIIEKRSFPMLNSLLPNKKMETYKRLFKIIKSGVSQYPSSINIDYEKAVMSAATSVFGRECKVNGCYFHLSQSLFRRVQTKGAYEDYMKQSVKGEEFRKYFKLLQALAYLPQQYIIDGFNYTERKLARYPIATWNVHDRVKYQAPITTNNLENWNGQIQSDERKHLTVFRIVKLFQDEQSKMENELVMTKKGEKLLHQTRAQIKKDKLMFELVNNFDKSQLFTFLESIAFNLGEVKKQ